MKNIAYGIHSCLSALERRPYSVQEVLLLDSRKDKKMSYIKSAAESRKIKIKHVKKSDLDQLCNDGNHQGVMLIFNEQQKFNEATFLEFCAQSESALLLLVLDQITDPHNLGACLRTAEAAGANAVICSSRDSTSITAVVRKVSCGASERIPTIFAKNLVRYLKELKQLGVWVYGTRPDSEVLIYNVDLTRSSAIVIGAEGKGMRRLTAESCDQLMRLPMSGEMESLNASVASGIALFEAVRQRISN